MWHLLLWVYIVNAALLIVHEIDSAYWHEWELFKLPGGITGFLLLHLPLVVFILFGLTQVTMRSDAGIVFSAVLAGGGLFAFCIHTYFLKRGRPEFRNTTSISILVATLLVSLVQAAALISLQIA